MLNKIVVYTEYTYQKIDDIKYHTGTRVYRVTNITEHFPKTDHIFGRWVKLYITANTTDNNNHPITQQERQAQQDEINSQIEQPQLDIISESPTLIQETPPSQQVNSPPYHLKNQTLKPTPKPHWTSKTSMTTPWIIRQL